MSPKGEGQGESGTERRVVVRSVRQAHAAEAALRARVAKAMAQIEALNQRGRGEKRFATVSAFRQAVVAMVQRYSVEDLIWFRLIQHDTPRPVRAYRGQPARVDHDRHARMVKIFKLAFPLEVAPRPSPALRLVLRPTLTHTQRP